MTADHPRRRMSRIGSAVSLILSACHDPAARILNVDLVAVLVAVMLPWSTSGVAIGFVLWLIALAATLELRPFLRSLLRPISALPIAFVALAALGTLWSDAPWGVRLYALSPVTKLLALPLLLLSLRAHDARHVGLHWLPGFLLAAGAGILAGDCSSPGWP